MSRKSQDLTRGAVLTATAVAVGMIAQQLVSKALRDALFLGNFPATALPRVMTGASILSVLLVLIVARAFRRIAPGKLVPVMFAASALLFTTEWMLSGPYPQIASVVLYIHTTSFGAVVISGFWSVVNERFDPYTARRVIGRVGGGATLGGVLGGLAAWQGASRYSISTMLLVVAAVNLACGIGVWRLGRGSRVSSPREEPETSALAVFEETPYLRQLAILVGVAALGAAGIEYVFKAAAAQNYGDSEDLVSFFALFYLGVGVATFALQNFAATAVLRWFGITPALASYPTALLGLSGLALLFPGLAVLTLLRGSGAVLESSLYRSGYELLYTPLGPEKKRPTKAVIDVGGDKLGAAAGSALAVFVVGLTPDWASTVLLAVAMGCAGLALALTRSLYRGYMQVLSDNLSRGSLRTEDLSLEDPGVRRQVEMTLAALERQRVLESSARPRDSEEARPPPRHRNPLAEPRSEPVLPLSDPDGELRALAALRSGEPDRVAWVLRRHQPLPPTWAGFVVELLGHEACRPYAQEALRRVAPVHLGLLSDVLLNRRASLEMRRCIPRLLGSVATRKSALILRAGFDAEPLEMRYRSAAAFNRVVRKNAELAPIPEEMFSAASRELDRCRLTWSPGALRADAEPGTRSEAGYALAFCVELLATVLPREPFLLAVDAMLADEKSRRGTGLEYLENVFPPDLKARLMPLLKTRSVVAFARRSRSELLRDLVQGSGSVRTLEEVRRRLQQWYRAG